MKTKEYTHEFTHRISSTWRALRTNWLIVLIHKSVLVLTSVSVILILWKWRSLPPLVPLWYSRPWGADQLTSPLFLFLLPLGNVFWYGIDFLLAAYVTSEYLIFTQALFSTTLVVSLLSLITLVKIVFLVT
ncbi:hypothetical protein HY031_00765 [Candidatus Gottesmanbacteria bacterium]|nr:hypothetical protein [Candidatus Gottesmanbacteria bacterium]